jgi:hypothetical protein
VPSGFFGASTSGSIVPTKQTSSSDSDSTLLHSNEESIELSSAFGFFFLAPPDLVLVVVVDELGRFQSSLWLSLFLSAAAFGAHCHDMVFLVLLVHGKNSHPSFLGKTIFEACPAQNVLKRLE